MPDTQGVSQNSSTQNSSAQAPEAAALAKTVVRFTLGAIAVLCVVALAVGAWGKNPTAGEMTRYVFASIIPLLGSWMGTVLAYYFSRENLAAATQSVRDLTQAVTGMDKLKATLVKDKMIPIAQIKSVTADDDTPK